MEEREDLTPREHEQIERIRVTLNDKYAESILPAAVQLRQLYEALVEEGFTEEQSFDLTKVIASRGL